MNSKRQIRVLLTEGNQEDISEIRDALAKVQGVDCTITYAECHTDSADRYSIEKSNARTLDEEREQEYRSMERLSHPKPTSVTAGIYSGEPLSESAQDVFNEMVSRYATILDMALEEQLHHEDNRRSLKLRQLGIDLGFLRASPRDVIDIHTTAIKSKAAIASWLKVQAYRDESRLTVLELMGNLTGYYRSLCAGLVHMEVTDE
ncbi:hypothetical protein ONV78_24170 [Hahella sp. CR1]|uniref:hypothetical protein n=1 Tax=Hahella sp. CR1 TaxID=2992807 RepID=UPI00244308E1|nr:hypothetical protein [Hahella sp. CR1]MDG9670857.1 hypothetical protein [Hahella sp. CR1]